MDLDLLALLENADQLGNDQLGNDREQLDVMAVLDDGSHVQSNLQLQVPVVAAVACRNGECESEAAAATESEQQIVAYGKSQAGRVGKGRHGDIFERRLLAAHMRTAKLAKRSQTLSQEVCALLDESKFLTSSGSIIGVRARSAKSSTGLVLELSKKVTRGNRYKRSITWAEFLEAAFGRFKRNSALAIYLQKGQSTIKNMQVFVSSGFMNQQALSLAKLASLVASEKPLLVLKHMRFDETALLCSLNPDKSQYRSRSSWQAMVYRLRVIVVWESGPSVVLPIIVPPCILLSTAAAHQYYALQHHPSFRCVNQLVKVMQNGSQHAMDLLEADGASSNNKLLGHMYNLAVAEGKFIAHARCLNHATQLINAAVLSSTESDILARMYGLTVFVRNLGYFSRLQQACRRWLSETLVFRAEAHTKAAMPSAAPQLQEFLEYLVFWRDLESDSPDKQSRRFRGKVERVLDIFNGDCSQGVCHVCTHSSLPVACRHCVDRDDCVQKAAHALTDLFLTTMPRIPVPSKWTTVYAPLDFVMGGFVINSWLRHVFQLSFGAMTFAEFDPLHQEADCRLIESLSFSAVNGSRCANSMRFLADPNTSWTVSIMLLVMEATRCLTFYFLGSLKKSLSCDRCVLYELLDPEVSIVAGLLQHLSALAMSEDGEGRLRLLGSPYPSAQKVRQLRRLLLLTSGWIYRRHHVYVHSLRYSICVVADPEANPGVKAAVCRQWDAAPVCCVPPGLPRMLKLRGVNADGLCEGRWRKVLHAYASTIQWSIADCEQKHAVNRQSSGSAFSTIAAKFVNAEALLERKQAQERHASETSAPGSGACRGGGQVRVQAKVSKQGQGLKALSALELFRRDYLKRQMLTGPVNPCSKDCWDAVRSEFANLSDEERAVYTSLAESSLVDAHVLRARKLSEKKQSEQHALCPAASASATGNVRQIENGNEVEASAVEAGALAPILSAPCHVPMLSFDEVAKVRSVQDLTDKIQCRRSCLKPSKLVLWLDNGSRRLWLPGPCRVVVETR